MAHPYLRSMVRGGPAVLLLFMAATLASTWLTAGTSHYAGHHQRDIKALSAEQVEGLLAGRGMGLALAAELNGYPGPLHVLELAHELELTDDQLVETQAVFDAMQAEASSIGHEIVAAERVLDRLFASGDITPARLQDQLHSIGELQARLRGVHLAAHLDQTDILTPEQIARYAQLRGYDSHGPHQQQHHGHHHHHSIAAWSSQAVRYHCEPDIVLHVIYLNMDSGESFASLYYDGNLHLLTPGPSASGVRYIATDGQGELVWHTKGDTGLLLSAADGEILLDECTASIPDGLINRPTNK